MDLERPFYLFFLESGSISILDSGLLLMFTQLLSNCWNESVYHTAKVDSFNGNILHTQAWRTLATVFLNFDSCRLNSHYHSSVLLHDLPTVCYITHYALMWLLSNGAQKQVSCFLTSHQSLYFVLFSQQGCAVRDLGGKITVAVFFCFYFCLFFTAKHLLSSLHP